MWIKFASETLTSPWPWPLPQDCEVPSLTKVYRADYATHGFRGDRHAPSQEITHLQHTSKGSTHRVISFGSPRWEKSTLLSAQALSRMGSLFCVLFILIHLLKAEKAKQRCGDRRLSRRIMWWANGFNTHSPPPTCDPTPTPTPSPPSPAGWLEPSIFDTTTQTVSYITQSLN